MLDERGSVIEHWISKSASKTGDFDILPSPDLVPVSQNVFQRGSGYQKGLAAKDRRGCNNSTVIVYIAGQLAKARIVQACQGYRPVFERLPLLYIMAKVTVKV
jgi:hypothetical protein